MFYNFFTDGGHDFRCLKCGRNIIGEIGHQCGSFSFLDDEEEDIYTKKDGTPLRERGRRGRGVTQNSAALLSVGWSDWLYFY